MKFTVSWHEACLANLRRTYEDNLRRHEQVAAILDRDRIAIAIYEGQIARAKAEGKADFDREKFNVRRK